MTDQIKIEEHIPGENELLLASILVQDAKVIRHMDFKHDPKTLRVYMFYNHRVMRWLLYLCIIGNLALAIFEKPAVVPLPYWATIILEVAFLSYFLVRFFHGAYCQEATVFWKDPKNWTVLITIILTFLDIICYCLWVNVAPPAIAAKAVRWSRPLRPLYMVNFPEGRQVRQAFRNIRRTLPEIANVLVLFICCMAIFALMARKLFGRRQLTYQDGSPYFSDYWDGFWSLYVLVTTANNPDVMMPAYDNNSWYSVFFVVYIMICLYIFMSIVLAVIYNKYRMHLKSEVKSLVYLKRKTLGKAFEQLKQWHAGRYVVTKETWEAMMKLVDSSKSEARMTLYFKVLDGDADDKIERSDFLKLSDLLNVDFIEMKNKPIFLQEKFPHCFNSKANQIAVKVIKHKYMRFFFDLLILANAICIGLDIDVMEWFFLSVFTLEILMKMYALGPVGFFKQFWNIFDFVIVGSALIATIVEQALDQSHEVRLIEIILVLRVLRLVRLLGSIDRFKIVIRTIVNIGPSILTYGSVIFVLYYIYAIIGMEIFQGQIKFYGYKNITDDQKYCGNPKLNGSEFWNKGYCKNNFNNIAQSFVLLFELMVVNQWHVLAQGYVLVTHKAARLFFISFHMLCVVILLNIFTAFVLEVFILEYTLSGTKLQNAIETKIKELGLGFGQDPVRTPQNDQRNLVDEMELNEEAGTSTVPATGQNGSASGAAVSTQMSKEPEEISPQQQAGLRFRLKKTSSKRIEVLLQNMFEGEIDPADEGPEEEEDMNLSMPRLSLDMVT